MDARAACSTTEDKTAGSARIVRIVFDAFTIQGGRLDIVQPQAILGRFVSRVGGDVDRLRNDAMLDRLERWAEGQGSPRA
jgi:hypothetical protein